MESTDSQLHRDSKLKVTGADEEQTNKQTNTHLTPDSWMFVGPNPDFQLESGVCYNQFASGTLRCFFLPQTAANS